MGRRTVLDLLSPADRDALDRVGRIRRFDRGEYLCLEGDPSSRLFIILSGLVRVERSTTDGRVILLEISGPGDLFGELGVLDGRPRSAAAMAIVPVRTLVISAGVLDSLYTTNPGILRILTQSVVERLRDLTDQLVEAGERSIVARVAARIVAVVDRSEHAAETGPFSLKMPIAQHELGQWAGLSREGIAKALRKLRDDEILSTGRQRLDIHRIDQLREIASQAR